MIPGEHFFLIAHVVDFPDPDGPRFRRDLALEIRDGIIAGLLRPEQVPPDHPALDLRPAWIMPGFVDLHTHPVQHRVRGRAGLPLLPWLERYVFPEEKRFEDLTYAESVFREAFSLMLRHGTTLVAGLLSAHPDVLDVAFEVVKDLGMRAILGWVWMETPEDFARPVSEMVSFARRQIAFWHGREDRFFFAVAPRFALSCSGTCLAAAGDLAREQGVFVHTHISENVDEVREVLRRFGASSYAEVYDRAGLLTERTFLAHGVYLWARELTLIRRRESVVVHCPTANDFLHSGRLPRRALRTRRIRMALGSDVGAGWTFNMLSVIRQAYLVEREPLHRLYYDATRGGALAASMDRLGLVEPGFFADFVVLRGDGEAEELLSRWAFVEERSPVVGVMVNGRWLAHEAAV